MAVLTVDHWNDPVAGLEELRRVGGRVEIARRLGGRTRVVPLRVPIACRDGFGDAFRGRPEAYLDPSVRRNISPFRRLPADEVAAGVRRLGNDLASGAWDARHGELRGLSHLGTGLRIVISDPA